MSMSVFTIMKHMEAKKGEDKRFGGGGGGGKKKD